MNTKNLLTGIALGALAGVVAGYFLSGKKAKDIPEDVKRAGEKIKEKINAAVDSTLR